jgi:hypothetical protein
MVHHVDGVNAAATKSRYALKKCSGELFWYAQQLLVHRPCDVGQDARPIHNGFFAPIPCGGDPLKNGPERLRHRYAGRGQLTVLSAVLAF